VQAPPPGHTAGVRRGHWHGLDHRTGKQVGRGHRVPQAPAEDIGLHRGESVGHHGTVDHVGDHGRPRAPPHPHGHDRTAATIHRAPDGAIDSGLARRASIAGGDEAEAPAGRGEDLGGGGELQGGGFHETILPRGCDIEVVRSPR